MVINNKSPTTKILYTYLLLLYLCINLAEEEDKWKAFLSSLQGKFYLLLKVEGESIIQNARFVSIFGYDLMFSRVLMT